MSFIQKDQYSASVESVESVESVCRGSLGELFQGPICLNNGIDIGIISALSDNYTLARFTPNQTCNLELIGKIKVKKAIDAYFEKFNEIKIEGRWEFESNCIVGAGMSSSTSDIVSALNCINMISNRTLTISDLCEIISGIERSDPIFIQVPSLYLSQKQEIVDIYYPTKKINCIYGVENKSIDTSSTKDILIDHYKKHSIEYSELLKAVQKAFKEKDIKEIIRCSTRSACLSQKIIPKENFETFIREHDAIGADGIVVAHTGSIIGFLYKDDISDEQLNKANELFPSINLSMKKGIIFNV